MFFKHGTLKHRVEIPKHTANDDHERRLLIFVLIKNMSILIER